MGSQPASAPIYVAGKKAHASADLAIPLVVLSEIAGKCDLAPADRPFVDRETEWGKVS